jgi:hypothetical protein
MGETKKIVTEHYPAEKLPEELRTGLDSGQLVRVTVEPESLAAAPRRPLTSYYGAAKGLYSSPEDVIESIRKLRDEWE